MGKGKRDRSAVERKKGLQRYSHKFQEVNGSGLAKTNTHDVRDAASFCLNKVGRPAIKAACVDFRIVSQLACGTMPPTEQNSVNVVELAKQYGWSPAVKTPA